MVVPGIFHRSFVVIIIVVVSVVVVIMKCRRFGLVFCVCDTYRNEVSYGVVDFVHMKLSNNWRPNRSVFRLRCTASSPRVEQGENSWQLSSEKSLLTSN